MNALNVGHCTDKRKPSGVVVVVGAFTRAKDEGIKHNVLLFAIHPDFDVFLNLILIRFCLEINYI